MIRGMEKLSILVFGAGAIGGYLGGSLALRGHHVIFLERAHNAPALREQGLHLQLGPEPHRITNVQIVGTIEEALHPSSFSLHPSSFRLHPFDVAFFALKSYDTAEALETLLPYKDQLPPVLCLQNGVENEAALASVLGARNVIAGTVTTAVAKDGPGRIRLERLRGVGLADGHPLSERLAAAMNDAGLNARLYAHAASMKWSKLLTNLLTNASCAILDLTPAQIMADPRLFAIEMRQLREALAVMRALNLRVVDLPGTPVRALALGARLPAILARPLMAGAIGRGRGDKMPSLHLDLHSGKGRSEVDWLNGAVGRAAAKVGLSAPVNRYLSETLLGMVSGHKPAPRITDFAMGLSKR